MKAQFGLMFLSKVHTHHHAVSLSFSFRSVEFNYYVCQCAHYAHHIWEMRQYIQLRIKHRILPTEHSVLNAVDFDCGFIFLSVPIEFGLFAYRFKMKIFLSIRIQIQNILHHWLQSWPIDWIKYHQKCVAACFVWIIYTKIIQSNEMKKETNQPIFNK